MMFQFSCFEMLGRVLQGFILLELLVIIVIVGILVGFVIFVIFKLIVFVLVWDV